VRIRFILSSAKQDIVSASHEVVGYNLETGKPLWRSRRLGQNIILAPVAADGLMFVRSGKLYRAPHRTPTSSW